MKQMAILLNVVHRYNLSTQRFQSLHNSLYHKAEFNFKQQNPRKPKPKHQKTLRDRRTLVLMGFALIATVAAPKIINDIVSLFDDEEKKKRQISSSE